MKTIARPIEMISWTDFEGNIQPVRYRITSKEGCLKEYKIVHVNRIEERRIAGDKTLIFHCETVVQNQQRYCEIRYNTHLCKWLMFKI